LITPVSKEDVQTSIYKVLAKVGVNTTNWKSGAVVRTMIVSNSIILAALSQLQANIARSGFLEFSSKDWLTIVAGYVYGLDRILATYASGSVTLVNSGGGVYTLAPGDLILVDINGKSYQNTASITIGSMATVTGAPFQAVDPGALIANVGDINALSTSLIGVTCTNTTTFIGTDDEEDGQLRIRCYEQLGALSPMGPWDAYGAAVRNAKLPDGTPIGVTRTRITKDGSGNVNVYLADGGGGLAGTIGNPSTPLGAADEAIQQFAAPLAVTANTHAATDVTTAVTYELWTYNTSGYTTDQITSLISKSIVAFFGAQPIGGNIITAPPGAMFVDALRSAIANTLPQIFHVVVTAPSGDVSLATSEVAVAGTITPTAIHQVTPPEGFST
jgi:hypothetical protein